MPMGNKTVWETLSFLVPPDEVSDWRRAVLVDAAAEAGLIEALPGTPRELAERLSLDERAVRIVLEALSVWDVARAGVDVDGDGGPRYGVGARAPDPAGTAALRHHARAVRVWSTNVGDRLRGVGPGGGSPEWPQVERMLEALVVNGRESAPGVVDACLARCPGARRVLDVAGGHGVYALEFARRGLAATVLDRPAVLEWADRDGALSAAGVTAFPADVFEELPGTTFDLVFCAGFSYTLDAARNQALLARLRPAVAGGGALAVMTFLRGTDPMAALFAVQMLAGGTGGEPHGEDDYRRWLAEEGYGDVEVLALTRRPEWLVLARN